MLLSILFTLKIIWFSHLIDIEYNRIPIIIISSLISIFILMLIYIKEGKYNKTLALIFYIIISVIMLVDATYYSYFNALPSIMVIKQVKHLPAVGDSVIRLLTPRVLLLILDIPLVIYYIKRHQDSSIINPRIRQVSPIALAIVFLAIIINLNVKGELSSVRAQELYAYHLVDIVDTILGSY